MAFRNKYKYLWIMTFILLFFTKNVYASTSNNLNQTNRNIETIMHLIQQNFPEISENSLLKNKTNLLENSDFSNGLSSWNPYRSKVMLGTLNCQMWIDSLEDSNYDVMIDEGNSTEIASLREGGSEGTILKSFSTSSNSSNIFLSGEKGAEIRFLGHAIKINNNKKNFISLSKSDDGQHYWLHQKYRDAKQGYVYIFHVNYMSYPYRSTGQVMLGKYGGDKESVFKSFDTDEVWRSDYIVYDNPNGPIDVVLYASSDQPIIYSNLGLYEVSKSELKEFGIEYNGDKKAYYDRIVNYLKIKDDELYYIKNKNNVLNMYKYLTIQDRLLFVNTFENELKLWFDSFSWKHIRKSENSAKQMFREFMLKKAQTVLPILSKWHPNLTSREYMLLYIQYLNHTNLILCRPDGTQLKGLVQNLEYLKAECWRASIYAGQMYNIIFNEVGYITLMNGHTVMSGQDFIMDPNYNVLFLFNADNANMLSRMPEYYRSRFVSKYTVYGFPKLLISPSKIVLNRTPQEISADYDYQMSKYLDLDDNFPIIEKTNIRAIFE